MVKVKVKIVSILLFSFLFSGVTTNLVESNDDYVIVEYLIHDFTSNLIVSENETFNEILLTDEPRFIDKNKPQLPHINRSFIIPDFSSISVEVLSSEYNEYQKMNIIPSKGNIKRNVVKIIWN